MKNHLSAVVGVPALPGTLNYDGTPFSQIVDQCVAEAKQLYSYGIRDILIQNIGDLPMIQKPGKDTTAFMSVVASKVRDALPNDCEIGISVLMNDGEGELAAAEASGADYIRAKIYVGAMVAAGGIETSCMDEVLQLKQRLGSAVKIRADIHDRTGVPLGNPSLTDACEQALSKGLADVLIITGKNPEETLSMVHEVKTAFPHTEVHIGGGAKPSNLKEFLKEADGIVVGSYLKKDGKIFESLDHSRLTEFMNAWQKAAEGEE
ncbi:MAG: BtpA/SgcQ family protein [Erysipelotrichales bacterium]|nr:BtpA/SgcQ family protein [Erysipelotrichales bacterium]